MKSNNRVPAAESLCIDKIPQKCLEQMEPIEEAQVDPSTQNLCRIIALKEVVAVHLIKRAKRFSGYDIPVQIEMGVDGNRCARRQGQRLSPPGSDFHVAPRTHISVKPTEHLVGIVPSMRAQRFAFH